MTASYYALYPDGTVFNFPTQWVMKQSLWLSDMDIKDANGQSVFHVKAKMLSLGYNLKFTDLRDGEEIAQIRQKIRLGMPHFILLRGDIPVARITQKLAWKPKFLIDMLDGTNSQEPLKVSGDWTGHDYIFTRGERQVARVTRKWLTLRDTYAVDILPREDVILILSCCIVIDKCTTQS